MMTQPPRGFLLTEFEQRLARAQERMEELQLDAVLLTTEPEVRYFTGFLTQFWESPTRPWFVVLPLDGKPIAIIPGIGAAGMRETWIEDIRTWSSPQPDDDGISLVTEALKEQIGRFERLGAQLGPESLLRMPARDFGMLKVNMGNVEFQDAAAMLHRLRFMKSPAEIAKIHYVCDLTSAAFEALPGSLVLGESERENCRRLRMDLLARGADSTPYVVAGSGPGGYDNIIMGPTDRILGDGDILIIDTGTTYDGYFCDFDRNFAFGHAPDAALRAHEVVYKATDAGFAAARPGATTTDVYNAMWSVMEAGGALGNDVGRLGHGLGMQLTEWPSNTPTDHTPLQPGVVLTLEPGMEFAPGKQMVHEENIVITEDGARWLSRRAPPEMPIIL
jgi:Xaa-Pro dipeptidase